MREETWSRVITARGVKKRGLEDNSTDEDDRPDGRKIDLEEYKIILRFKKEDEQVVLRPITLYKVLWKKVGDEEVAKVLKDRNFFIKCRTEEQNKKALSIKNICKKLCVVEQFWARGTSQGESYVVSWRRKIWKNSNGVFRVGEG